MGAAQKLFGFVSLVSVSYFSYLFLVRIKKKIQPKEKVIEKEVYDGERKRKRENESSTPPNINLPCELIENILLCLPVKDLLRCKCVSKSWFILICSTHFVNKHLEYCARSRTRVGLIVKENANDNWIRTVHLDDMPGNNQCDAVRVETCDPVPDTGNSCDIVGSCNGLVCFTSKFDHLTIWNPSTRKAHNLSCRPRGFDTYCAKILIMRFFILQLQTENFSS
ncbi:F-box/kelch-repeat protein At3g23880-like [Actinidia eriantha]|uniref:F-box/kelch-repeat protein At3g23880-like n=1 Tax=Actinidia eriantha TaxID=165200 RepID=UPI0025878C2F|nr:F-box/kelch-repeat protein At3g23880-like [Actinidia eriantha]